jgi:3D-(3,5/4)-trihydroxycyclohexane-1,2-dione acylhydrolase (decyclizing)
MGYEIAAGLGVKLAQPNRNVYVMVGDGSYLMMAQEIATAVQERIPLTILVLDNHGFGSIGGLSASLGCEEFGTRYTIDVDFVANAASMGAHAVLARTRTEITKALERSNAQDGVNVIVIPVDRDQRVGGYESWWDVPIAEVSPREAVQRARAAYDTAKRRKRQHL